MTPSAIIALIKDVVIVVAVGAVAYFLITYGKDIVKVDDIKAVTKQLQDNVTTQARWQKESTDADTQHVASLAKITDLVSNQRTPVFVRGPTCPNPVSAPAAKAGDSSGPSGATDQGRGVDYRPVINEFESHYETALADCYAALDKWPR